MQHNVGSFTLPKAVVAGRFDDSLLVNLGTAIKSYVNTNLGSAYAQVNGGDGYVIKNVHCFPMQPIEAVAQPQLPAIFISRDSIERERFTFARDKITVSILVQFVVRLADVNLGKQFTVLNHVPMAIESMLFRSVNHLGNDLLEYLNCEEIAFKSSKIAVIGTRQMSAPGFYTASIRINCVEIVEPATEDLDDLLTCNVNIDLDGDNTDGYFDDGYAYPLPDFIRIEINES